MTSLILAGWAESPTELANWRLLALSLRHFGGSFSGTPVHVYHNPELSGQAAKMVFPGGVYLKPLRAPDESGYPFSNKVYAAAAAEESLCNTCRILAWLDDDTLLLDEPAGWLLDEGIDLSFRPVMHRNIGMAECSKPDDFWSRALALAGVSASDLLPLKSPAFGEIVRGYINAGCLIVRPEVGLLRRWASLWQEFSQDPRLAELAAEDPLRRTFLHQVALAMMAAPVLSSGRARQLPEGYNMPLFFQAMFGAAQPYDDISCWVSLRHENAFRGLLPDAHKRLKGPQDRCRWILEQAWS
jgi:hypothetical protein